MSGDFAHGRRPDPHDLDFTPPAPTEQRSEHPVGATARYVEAVRAKFGTPYVESWFDVRNSEFGDAVVYTTRLGAERLERDTGEIAQRFGVEIRFCSAVQERFAGKRAV